MLIFRMKQIGPVRIQIIRNVIVGIVQPLLIEIDRHAVCGRHPHKLGNGLDESLVLALMHAQGFGGLQRLLFRHLKRVHSLFRFDDPDIYDGLLWELV